MNIQISGLPRLGGPHLSWPPHALHHQGPWFLSGVISGGWIEIEKTLKSVFCLVQILQINPCFDPSEKYYIVNGKTENGGVPSGKRLQQAIENGDLVRGFSHIKR